MKPQTQIRTNAATDRPVPLDPRRVARNGINDGQIHAQAGCGVVADSVPQSEWDETVNKARAVMRAAADVCGTAK